MSNASFNLTNRTAGGRPGRPVDERCHCGLAISVKTSWTNRNPGRRFVCCPQKRGQTCRYWDWYDPEMCERSRQIIPGLLTKINVLEGELSELKSNDAAKNVVFGKIGCVLVFVFVVLCILVIW